MLEREKEMKIVIEMYQRKQKKEALTRWVIIFKCLTSYYDYNDDLNNTW
jgi:hypothetical protein